VGCIPLIGHPPRVAPHAKTPRRKEDAKKKMILDAHLHS
jgi:hypothetical protein